MRKKRKNLCGFHKALKFFSHAFFRTFPPHQCGYLFPGQLIEELIPDNPLHPERNLLHPLFHSKLQIRSYLPLLFQNPLLSCQRKGICCRLNRSAQAKRPLFVRPVWITPPNLVLNKPLFLLQLLDLCFCLLDKLAGIYVVFKNCLLYTSPSPRDA